MNTHVVTITLKYTENSPVHTDEEGIECRTRLEVKEVFRGDLKACEQFVREQNIETHKRFRISDCRFTIGTIEDWEEFLS